MRRSLLLSLVLLATAAGAQDRKAPRDADLGKKATTQVDASLAGDLSRKKEAGGNAPALQYDQYRLGVELQVASKRREQIDSLRKIIQLSGDQKEQPSLLFRLGELYWEEAKFHFFEANRKDDALIQALNRGDRAGQERARQEKSALMAKSREYGKLAVEQYTKIVQGYGDYERMDEVLYFLGQFLMENGEEKKALVAYKRLVEKYPKSKYIPDAWVAFGEYYFNNSKGQRPALQRALEAYTKAAQYPESQVYAFAIYKQGWSHFNLTDYEKAKDRFKTVVLYGELAGAAAVEKDGGKSGKGTLIKEARNDYVRAYAREGDPQEARAEFGKVASKEEDRFTMLKQLANLYYEDGKDREAAFTYNVLIKEKPLSPEAPGFQAKIVDCILRLGDKGRTVAQVRRLVKIIQDVEGANVVREEKDKKALVAARELAERTLSNLAVTWHNEGKKTRDEQTYGFANDIYEDYLTLFPDNPKAYDLRFFWAELLMDQLHQFEKAAQNYTRVVLQDAKVLDQKDEKGRAKPGKPGKWLPNAAYAAVLAWDEVVKAQEAEGKLKTEVPADPKQKAAIPGPKMALLEACDRYLKYLPKGDKRVEIAFKAANIYYRANHFDEAVLRFSEIALGYPDHKFENGERAAEVAANLILDSYNFQQDYKKLNEWARRFYANDKLATGTFRDQLAKLIEQSAFKLVNQLEARKDYAGAAEAYLAFVSEFPRSDIADKALYNASVDYFQAKMLDRSIEVRRRLVQQYPRSSFIPNVVFANAEALEALGDFREAADTYEQYVRGYERSLDGGGKAPARASSRRARGGKKGARAQADDDKKDAPKQVWDEAKAQVALFNAGTYREGLGEYKAALKDREHFLELWPKAKDSEQVALSIASIYEKMGAYGRAQKQLEEYERDYKAPSKVLSAEGRITRIYAEKLRRPRDVARMQKRIMEYYEQLGRRTRSELEKPAIAAVADAQFASVEPDWNEYRRLKLYWGRPASVERFKASVADKSKALNVVQKAYTQTVALGAPEPAICALYRIGLSFHDFADKVTNAPLPPGTDEETAAGLREGFANEAQPIKEKATEAFAAAVAKSAELDVFTDCTRESLKLLRTTYAPERFPEMPEETLPVLPARLVVQGGGLLTAVQPVPASGSAPAAAQPAKLQKDLDALGRSLRDAPAASEPAQARDARGGQKTQKPAETEEPEDFLK